MSDRHFTVESMKVGGKTVHTGGRYSGEPSAAAKKALTSYAKEHGVKTVSAHVTVRETTQGSKHKHFSYKVARSKLDKPITHKVKSPKGKGTVITYKYKTSCKAV